MDDAALQRTVKRIKELPSLPSVVQRILDVVNNPESTAQHLNDIVLNDPALSSKIMKLVNSAFYGFPGRINSLKEAIVILGFNTVRSLALSLSMMDYFSPLMKSSTYNMNELWRHSIAAGTLARRLGKKDSIEMAETLFIAGLLHDVGHVIMNHFYPSEFELALNVMEEDKVRLFEAEEKVFNMNHAHVAELLFQAWTFPEAICRAVGGHHDPNENAPYFRHSAFIHVADMGVKLMRIGSVGDNDYVRQFHFDEAAMKELQLEPETVMSHQEKVAASVEAGGKILSL